MLPLATKHMTRKRDAQNTEIERARERDRKEFEEHHRLQHDVSRLRGTDQMRAALNRVKQAAQRLAAGGKPKRKKKRETGGEVQRQRTHRQIVTAMGSAPAEFSKDDNHVLLPMPAVNRAAEPVELFAISAHIQGFVLAYEARRAGVATYGLGPHKAALANLPAVDRAELIGMHGHVNRHIIGEMRQVLDVIVMQTLASADGRVPTLSEIGGVITKSEDERVRKGGVVGYYRALFQTLASLQQEYRIKEACRRIEAKKAGKP